MKCKNCGAEIKEGAKFCESCGSQISYEMKREQERLNKAGCPKCGSSNVTFNREKQGEVQGKNGKAVVRATVGLCKDCGYTWNTSSDNTTEKKKNNMVWWILGWIFFFPAPVMILVWRKKNTWTVKTKTIVTVVFWIIIFVIGAFNNSTSDSEVKSITENDKTANIESHIYDNAEVVDLMNGLGTDKIGTITVTKAKQSECTEDAMIEWYFNYVKNNTGSNYHIIVYSDNMKKGIYTLGSGFIQKDVELIAEDNGTYMLGDDAGSTYYTVDESSKTLNVQTTMADESIVEDVKAKVDAIIPTEYKDSDLYSVDVAGEEGSLDCNLTLINDKFAEENCQSIAEELATKVKELDLGIGYFCIAFQSDDYTLKAISSIDNLSNQDVSDISTKDF